MCKHSLSHEYLLSKLHYDPISGIFVWKTGGKYNRLSGKIVGTNHSGGYTTTRIKTEDGITYNYFLHRLAWFYIYKSWPEAQIDHINGIRNDNRLINLRIVTNQENAQNKRNGSRKNTTTGLMGVRKNHKRWAASITLSGKNFYIGTFDTPEEAHKAYIEVKRKLHKACTI